MIEAEPSGLGELFPNGTKEIRQYVDILLSDGVTRGLIGPRESERIWSRHILNSLALGSMVGQGVRVVDVGSGGGLPGIPLALARPDISVTLLEPLLRRVRFLGEVIERLGIGDQVAVVRGRAEDHDESYDCVVSRAVAPLSKLVGWCVPLLAEGGEMLSLKGERADQELQDAAKQLDSLGLIAEVESVSALHESTNVVRLRCRG